MTGQDTRVGTQLGKYRLLHRLGEGGMGVVYAAEDPILLRKVAIKILSGAAIREADAGKRFVLEARAAAGLNHPNVVTVHDIGREGNVTYIVMELVDGASAQAVLRERGALPWPKATRIIADVCRGLAAAHAVGLIHRDIKPANILLGGNGSVKLTDFGLAKAPHLIATHATQPGMILGTPHYMSPEQCAGERIDARADLYALGGAYYALLTGRPPYDGSDSVKIMYAQCTAPVPDPRDIVAALPEACAAIVMKAMAKKRSDRFRTPQEMLTALTNLLATLPTAVALPTMPATAINPALVLNSATLVARPQRRRYRLVGTAAVLFVLAIASITAFAVFRSPRADDSRRQPAVVIQSALYADGDPITLKPRTPLGKHNGEARGLAFGGRHFASVGADKIARVWNLDHLQESPKIFEHPHELTCVALTPDGKWLATGNRDASFVTLWDVETGKELGNIKDASGPWSLAFHPSERRLAVGSGDCLQLIDLDADGKEIRRARLQRELWVATKVAFTPDGKQLGVTSYKPGAFLLDGASLKESAIVASEGEHLGLSFSADGKRIVFAKRLDLGKHHELFLWEPQTGRPPRSLTSESGGAVINAAAFAPGGRQIAYGGTWGGPVKLLELTSGKSLSFPTNANGNVSGLAFSPDSHLLAATCSEGSVLVWDVVPAGRQDK